VRGVAHALHPADEHEVGTAARIAVSRAIAARRPEPQTM